MSTATPEKSDRMTAADLLALPEEKFFELIDGKLVELKVSALSSAVAARLIHLIYQCIGADDAGWIFGADCGYQCFPFDSEQVRRPDVSYIAPDRLPRDQQERGYVKVVPDLVVEVVSPNDLFHDVEEKVAEYLTAGVQLVWVVDPIAKMAYVHRQDASSDRVLANDTLSGEDVLPGFECRITDLIPPSNED